MELCSSWKGGDCEFPKFQLLRFGCSISKKGVPVLHIWMHCIKSLLVCTSVRQKQSNIQVKKLTEKFRKQPQTKNDVFQILHMYKDIFEVFHSINNWIENMTI